MRMNPIIKQGMILTWWAVASVIIGAIIRIELLPPRYENSFIVASFVYSVGWFFTVIIHVIDKSDKQ